MVRQQQDMFWGGRRSAVDLGATPDWPALAAAFGVTACDDIDAALAEPGPALVRIAIDPESDCLPMFRPGGAAREMLGYTTR
jgi:acetolactate synthase-1/2/3 large subunit